MVAAKSLSALIVIVVTIKIVLLFTLARDAKTAGAPVQLDNVLIDRRGGAALPIVKLCDFGYSKAENFGSGCKTACGTPEYMAPEVRAALAQQLHRALTAARCAIWAQSMHASVSHGFGLTYGLTSPVSLFEHLLFRVLLH